MYFSIKAFINSLVMFFLCYIRTKSFAIIIILIL